MSLSFESGFENSKEYRTIRHRAFLGEYDLDLYIVTSITNKISFLEVISKISENLTRITFSMEKYINDLCTKIEEKQGIEFRGKKYNYGVLESYENYLKLLK